MPEYQYNCEAAVKKLHQGIIEQESEIDKLLWDTLLVYQGYVSALHRGFHFLML